MELLAFLANLLRRHDNPWHFARTDIGCPRSRAKKCPQHAHGSGRSLNRNGKEKATVRWPVDIWLEYLQTSC